MSTHPSPRHIVSTSTATDFGGIKYETIKPLTQLQRSLIPYYTLSESSNDIRRRPLTRTPPPRRPREN
ncbi:hypothetical protein C0995_006506 [Termitomyces sp. Mi166|nr:hypothetical protein C0995_006506 [Termitomyces sp. Mi166\